MKLPWQKSDSSQSSSAQDSASPAPQSASPAASAQPAELGSEEAPSYPKGYTPPKGRPTPKRKDQERKRGVLREPYQAPETAKEARERRKRLKSSMSKEEYKQYKAQQKQERRAEQRRVQDAMDRGDERYLLDRDKGEVRAFARDWVDARRFITNMMMPLALILLFVMLVSNAVPEISLFASVTAMIIMFAIFVEGVIMGRRVNAAAREKFPHSTDPGLALGFYAFSRAGQPRRWRSPKPRVAIGAKV